MYVLVWVSVSEVCVQATLHTHKHTLQTHAYTQMQTHKETKHTFGDMHTHINVLAVIFVCLYVCGQCTCIWFVCVCVCVHAHVCLSVRFVYEDLSSTKIDNRVVFPHTCLDVTPFLAGPATSFNIYDLYSIVCHYGGQSSPS